MNRNVGEKEKYSIVKINSLKLDLNQIRSDYVLQNYWNMLILNKQEADNSPLLIEVGKALLY